MCTYFFVLAGPDFTGSIWSGGVLSTQSPECERGRGDHKLPQPYGQPSPGAAQLYFVVIIVWTYEDTISLSYLPEQHEVEEQEEK